MRDLNLLNRYRIHVPGYVEDSLNGAFFVPSNLDHAPLKIIACCGDGWDHVSVSRKTRCPNWNEMEQVKRMFFHDHETVMQLHVPPADHISYHPYVLHLWRPLNQEIPRPPAVMVYATKAEVEKYEKETHG